MPEIDRRGFLKLAGASAGAAAAAGCSDHVEKLIPYVVQPEEITPGVPVFYASTCRECAVGCGVHVKTREGRPIKLEGNPEHPINRGRVCAKAQASLERTYHPDRYHGPQRRSANGQLEAVSWDEAISQVATAIRTSPARARVLGCDAGDTASALLDRVVAATGMGARVVTDPFAREALRAATEQVFGVASLPVFDLSGADLVIDFGSELFETGLSPVEHQRQWAESRDIASHSDGGAKLVYVGARLSLTASSADEWLAARPGSEGTLALALARAAIEAGAGGGAYGELLSGVLAEATPEVAAKACDVPADAIRRLGSALARAKAPVALPPGTAVTSRRAVGSTAAVLLLNQVVGAAGTRMIVPAPAQTARRASYKDVLALIREMRDGQVDVLLIHHSNPVYALPASTGFREALAKVKLVVSFASLKDETSELAGVVLPDHSALEGWGDARPRAGVRSLVQPTLRPLYDTRAFGDAILDLGRAVSPEAAAQLPSGSFRSELEAAWADVDFRAALKAGGVYETPVHAATGFDVSQLELAAPVFTGEGELVLLAFPHPFLGDGGGAALPLLQEIPDPTTHVAWESWAELSLATADRLGVELGDVVRLESSAGAIEVSVFPRGGIRDDVIAVPTGQGHRVGHFASKAGQGMPDVARGVNVADVLPGDGVDETGGRAWLTEKPKVTAAGRHRRLPLLQWTDNKRERQLGEAITLAAFTGHGDAHGDGEHHGPHEMRAPFDPAKDAADAQYERTFHEKGENSAKASPYRWGMTVDLDRCTGCSACIAACYVENNLPRVGENETRLVRQMAWLRIDRWVGNGEPELVPGRDTPSRSREKLGDTDVRNAPLLCQHCGAAPCEPVCPVIATFHNEEGLNAMIYNRCIGTRYCANNCPYKVRRFNYWDHQLTKWPAPMELGLNPDVTVRGQGVMEKCTFCVQRVQYARQDSKNAGQATIPDGAVETACQQTCPSNAITFGNLRDPQSAVSKKAADEKRRYAALHMLNTRPAVTYLSKVIRGKVEG
jgi:anaerobic selenocysteine-containing dehydrogenase/Fe-S-cluster-containing dehydrogenase component